MKRECLHPNEIPPDPKKSLPLGERIQLAVFVTILAAALVGSMVLLTWSIYDAGHQRGIHEQRERADQEWNRGYNTGMINMRESCRHYGFGNDCLAPGYTDEDAGLR